MTITKATQEDLRAILDLQHLAYQSEAKLCNNPRIPPLVQTLDEVKQEFERGIFLKAVDDNGDIIASVRAYSENDTLYIGKLIVHPDFQGRGIGTALLKEIEILYPHSRYELFTSSKSLRNIALYERLGYASFKEQIVSDNLKFIYLEKLASV